MSSISSQVILVIILHGGSTLVNDRIYRKYYLRTQIQCQRRSNKSYLKFTPIAYLSNSHH